MVQCLPSDMPVSLEHLRANVSELRHDHMIGQSLSQFVFVPFAAGDTLEFDADAAVSEIQRDRAIVVPKASTHSFCSPSSLSMNQRQSAASQHLILVFSACFFEQSHYFLLITISLPTCVPRPLHFLLQI